MRLLRSTTEPTPANPDYSTYKRSHSHSYSSEEFGSQKNQEHGSPVSSSLTRIGEFTTPVSSNKQMVSYDAFEGSIYSKMTAIAYSLSDFSR